MTDLDRLDALADCDDALTLAEAALDAAVRERDELREALRESCQFCHHPIGWHTFEDGHPSGEMAPWCYCSAQFIGRLAALDAAIRERDELREGIGNLMRDYENNRLLTREDVLRDLRHLAALHREDGA